MLGRGQINLNGTLFLNGVNFFQSLSPKNETFRFCFIVFVCTTFFNPQRGPLQVLMSPISSVFSFSILTLKPTFDGQNNQNRIAICICYLFCFDFESFHHRSSDSLSPVLLSNDQTQSKDVLRSEKVVYYIWVISIICK